MSRYRVPLSGLSLVCLLGFSLPVWGGSKGPRSNDKVLFTFAIFGDNKSGGEWLDKIFLDMKKIKPSFIIGMGDHYKQAGSMESFEVSVKKAFGYERLWITQGDNEDQFYGGRQSRYGAQHKFFVRLRMFGERGNPLRPEIQDANPEMMDYYAQLVVKGVRIHLVSMYEHDSMKMQPSTLQWANRVIPRIRSKYPGEPWIVMAHDGKWWNQYFKPGHDIYFCDFLMGASLHRYAFYGAEGGGTNLAFNTSAVGRGGNSWYAVMVLEDKFVLLNMDCDRFRVFGRPGCHIKPLGKTGYDGEPDPWFKVLQAYGASVQNEWGPMPTVAKLERVRKARSKPAPVVSTVRRPKLGPRPAISLDTIRPALIADLEQGNRPTVKISVGGRTQSATVVGASDRGITVRMRGAEVQFAWDQVPNRLRRSLSELYQQ